MTRNNTSTAEKLQEDIHELLKVPTVVRRLGDYAIRLSGVADRLMYTEVDSAGFLELKDGDIDKIPLTVRHLGQRAVIHAKNSGMNSKQVGSLNQKLGSGKSSVAAEKTEQYFLDSQSHHELVTFLDKDGLAVTSSNFWRPEPGIIAYGRPNVSINSAAVTRGRLSPVVAAHELTHILQRESNPIGRIETLARNKLRGELEAYHVAAQIAEGMKDAGRQRELLEHTPKHEVERALKIEKTRDESQQSSDPFDPNNRVLKSMVDNGLGITAELGKVIRDLSPK